MAPHRRDFLKLAAFSPAIWAAQPAAEPVVFCRVQHRSAQEACRWIDQVTGAGRPVAIDGATLRYPNFVASFEAAGEPRLVLCRPHSTLVIDSRGWRRFA